MNEITILRLMSGLEDILVPLGICVVLPVMVVWLVMRHKTNETNRRTEIVLATINKNADVDVEEFLKKLNPPRKSAKRSLLQKMMGGSILTALGISFGGYASVMGCIGGHSPEKIESFGVIGAILFLVGVAILIVCLVSKKALAKEIEAENKCIEQ